MRKKIDRRRRAALARIHIAKKQLALEDGTYREMLHSEAGVRSAADLDGRGLNRVLGLLDDYLRKAGIDSDRSGRAAGPLGKRRLLWKIHKLLGDRPPSYARSILRNQGGPDHLEWATPAQLRKVVAALNYDRLRKHGGRSPGTG